MKAAAGLFVLALAASPLHLAIDSHAWHHAEGHEDHHEAGHEAHPAADHELAALSLDLKPVPAPAVALLPVAAAAEPQVRAWVPLVDSTSNSPPETAPLAPRRPRPPPV